jgi:PKD repeat protein
MHAVACQSIRSHFPIRLPSTSPIACPPGVLIPGLVALILLLTVERTLAAAAAEQLYPIGVSRDALVEVAPGAIIDNLFEGGAPGQFGWLSWSGSPSEHLLALSLRPPGNSMTYVNPDEPRDNVPSPGNWVSGKPGVSNSRGVRDALDALLDRDAVVPVWDAVRGKGAHAQYRIVAFARIRLLDYRLGGRGRIRARFLGFVHSEEANRPPTVDAGSDQTAWLGEPIEIEGTAHDDGLPPGATLSIAWSLVAGPGTVTFGSAGALCTEVSFDLPGIYRLRLEVSDTQLTGDDEVTISVAQPNRPPVGFPMSLALLEDHETDVLLDGIDPDGDALTFSLVMPPSRGTLMGDPPRFRYLPLPDFNGEDSFTFMVSDGGLSSAETVVSLIVLPVNDAPIADDQTVTLLEDASTQILLTGADLEGNALEFNLIDSPMHGVLSGTPPNLVFTPSPDFNGTDQFEFVVNDGELESPAATVFIEVLPVNDAPSVSAGLDQVVYLDQSTVLDGRVTDDGTPPGANLEWHWSVASGPGVGYLDEPGSLTSGIQFDAPGIYVLRLTASDTELSTVDELTITVQPRNLKPVVHAGEDQLIAYPSPATLQGTASDDGLPEGGEVLVNWERLDGPGAITFTDPRALTTLAHFDQPGRYRLRLSVSDSHLANSDELEIIANLTPTASAGPDLVASVGQPIRFLGTILDDGLPTNQLHAAWNRLDGPSTAFIAQPHAPETETHFLVSGTYNFRLTVTDGHLSAHDDLQVLVRPAGENLPPRVDAGPDRFVAGTNTVQLYGHATDDGLPLDAPLLVSWMVVNGPGEVAFDSALRTNAMARFSVAGVYDLQLSVSDGEFTVADTVSFAIYPHNQPPVVDAGPDQILSSGPACLTPNVTDDGLPSGVALSFRWELSSGPGEVQWTDPDQALARAAFSEPGVYTLRLTASDSEFEASDAVIVTVTGNQAPWVNAGPDQLLDLFVPGEPPPAITLYPFLPPRWDYSVGQPGLSGSWVRPNSLAASGTDLYIGGAFATAGGLEVRSMAKWDGCSFSALFDPRPINPDVPGSSPIGFIAHTGTTEPVAARGDEVFVAGGFLRDLDQNGFLDFTARWTGTGWESWGFKIASSFVTSRVFLATPDAVYFAGQFKFQTSNVPAAPISFNIAKWNGQDWERLGDGIRDLRDTTALNSIQYGVVNALALAPNGDLYAGGHFVTQTPTGLATNLARWNGANWAPVSPIALAGCHGFVCDPIIYAPRV